MRCYSCDNLVPPGQPRDKTGRFYCPGCQAVIDDLINSQPTEDVFGWDIQSELNKTVEQEILEWDRQKKKDSIP